NVRRPKPMLGLSHFEKRGASLLAFRVRSPTGSERETPAADSSKLNDDLAPVKLERGVPRLFGPRKLRLRRGYDRAVLRQAERGGPPRIVAAVDADQRRLGIRRRQPIGVFPGGLGFSLALVEPRGHNQAHISFPSAARGPSS